MGMFDIDKSMLTMDVLMPILLIVVFLIVMAAGIFVLTKEPPKEEENIGGPINKIPAGM